MSNQALSHIDEHHQPRMVSVLDKVPTQRKAVAEARIRFPETQWSLLADSGFVSSKGAILDVARVAGTMAVKRTSDLIPFCHPLPVSACTFRMEPLNDQWTIRIECTVAVCATTGVEMEALTGATIAALTLYDMTKSLGHGIVIDSVHLLSKSGGKNPYSAT